ncbi:SGNH/GDSL hydrolase family protein [Streptomyces sp. I05A-00742]|uniref:SGNH/GDSL hydrolase family protein n=1 Tax=Streptomyces sp. I05A-00742 TaxID=2732853 RepID=UPI00289C3233|nr:SGNH/GDSL hydrolase family protein [Streptomyces sp. I05A-00742]
MPRLAVMPLGDSITHGVGSSNGSGYRGPLWDRLTGHAGTLDFVGSERSGRLSDPDNEGHPGWEIENLSANIGTWLPAARPNVVLVHIGTNDLHYNHGVDTAPDRLGALIDKITSAAPDMTVLVSSLVPSADPRTRNRVDAFNTAIPKLVAERRDRGFHVGYVDMGRLTQRDLIDKLHPNDTGFTKMTEAFSDGIARAAADGWIRQQVDVRPAPPSKASPDTHRGR